MKRLLALVAVLVLTFLSFSSFAVNRSTEKFPLRDQYDVTIIETPELKQRFDQFVIVDVRSKYEYDTLRVRGAQHISMSDPHFLDLVRDVQKRNPGKPVLFYCNGTTCRKSYDAAAHCEMAGISDTVVYDAGIHEWATTHPGLALLFGRAPGREDLISDAEFKRYVVSSKEFGELVEANQGTRAIVLDIRDRIQRDWLPWPMRGTKHVPLDQSERIDRVIEQAKKEGKFLLVYDATGHQIRWFQYYLKQKGATNYRLMKGGAQAYFDYRYGGPEPVKEIAKRPEATPAEVGGLVRVKGKVAVPKR